MNLVKRWILPFLVVAWSGPASPHEILDAVIQHRIHLAVGSRHIDLTIDLFFFADWSGGERAIMDLDSNRRIREDFRFWKFDHVDPLIHKRLSSPAEIEIIVAEARPPNASSKDEGDRYVLEQLALQGDALLQRVQLARTTYAKLTRTAEMERRARNGE